MGYLKHWATFTKQSCSAAILQRVAFSSSLLQRFFKLFHNDQRPPYFVMSARLVAIMKLLFRDGQENTTLRPL